MSALQKIIDLKMEANKIEVLLNEFPDLELVDLRRGYNICYVSRSHPERFKEVDIQPSCGCCDDAMLYAYPCTIFDDQKIYSGTRIDFAQGTLMSIDELIVEPEWFEEAEKKGVSTEVLSKITDYISERKNSIREEEGDDGWFYVQYE